MKSVSQPIVKTGAALPSTALVIFGFSGNLSSIKLLPALYHLVKHDMLPKNCKIIGVLRDNEVNLDQIMQGLEITMLRTTRECDADILRKLRSMIMTFQMDSTKPEDFDRLRDLLDSLDAKAETAYQRLYYLAIPPSIFNQTISCLAESGLNKESYGRTSRILVEKPFGTHLADAHDLVKHISKHFDEHQIYRIDHYMAKETTQNILTFRFENPLIEDVWNKQFIDHIQISVLEMIGVAPGRADFYEGMGALRDMVQSHLLQLMATTMMEDPRDSSSEAIHEEKLTLLNSVRPIKKSDIDKLTSRGQYKGYTDDIKRPKSHVETYAALELEVDNPRWEGVPVLLRTGKSMESKLTEINVVFKDRAHRTSLPNILTIRIQPNEGIAIRLNAKKPGFANEFLPVNMDFSYGRSFRVETPDAYERVLVDAMAGDQTLFASSLEVLRCWEIIEPVLQNWQHKKTAPAIYKPGSAGPAEADELANKFTAGWLNSMKYY